MARFKGEYGRVLVTLQGSGVFPFDCMAFDYMTPASKADAKQLDPDLDRTVLRTIRFIQFVHTSKLAAFRGPTRHQGIWAGTGWSVVSVEAILG